MTITLRILNTLWNEIIEIVNNRLREGSLDKPIVFALYTTEHDHTEIIDYREITTVRVTGDYPNGDYNYTYPGIKKQGFYPRKGTGKWFSGTLVVGDGTDLDESEKKWMVWERVDFRIKMDRDDTGELCWKAYNADFPIVSLDLKASLNMKASVKLFKYLNVEEQLVTRFFIIFSRLEYALKRAKYIKGNKGYASADWDKFASDLVDVFNPSRTSELQKAVRYFQDKPPKKQIVREGQLSWKNNVRGRNEPLIIWLLGSVRIVRNNLFHGGKFPSSIMTDPARDSTLIKSSITILEACLELNSEVKSYFLDLVE